mgnify:CR=1 FL=1
MGKIKLFQPGSLFISPVLHTQVFHKVDSNLRQPVLSPLKHFHTVTFSLLSLQMARSLWIVIWSGLNLANSCDLLVESQFFQHHSFVTQTAVYLLFLLLLLLLYFSPSSHGLQAILLCSSLIICHWLRQPDCQSHSRGQPTCLFPFTAKTPVLLVIAWIHVQNHFVFASPCQSPIVVHLLHCC